MSKVVYHIQVHALTPRGEVKGILFYDAGGGTLEEVEAAIKMHLPLINKGEYLKLYDRENHLHILLPQNIVAESVIIAKAVSVLTKD